MRTTPSSSSRRATRSSSPAPSPVDERLDLIAPARDGLGELLEAAVRGGVDIVQIREKGLADAELLPRLHEARELTRRLGSRSSSTTGRIWRSSAQADFVHLGQDDLPVDAAVGSACAVGQSTHSPEEIDAAEADYIGVGPVHETPTKDGRPAVGLELVRYAAQHARQPWFAIGGIDETNVADVVVAGARRIAVVRATATRTTPSAQRQPSGTRWAPTDAELGVVR